MSATDNEAIIVEDDFMTGYVKFPISVINEQWYTDSAARSVYLHLCLRSQFKDTFYNGTRIPRGCAPMGAQVMADQLNMNVKTVRRGLEILEEAQEIFRAVSHNRQSAVVAIRRLKDRREYMEFCILNGGGSLKPVKVSLSKAMGFLCDIDDQLQLPDSLTDEEVERRYIDAIKRRMIENGQSSDKIKESIKLKKAAKKMAAEEARQASENPPFKYETSSGFDVEQYLDDVLASSVKKETLCLASGLDINEANLMAVERFIKTFAGRIALSGDKPKNSNALVASLTEWIKQGHKRDKAFESDINEKKQEGRTKQMRRQKGFLSASATYDDIRNFFQKNYREWNEVDVQKCYEYVNEKNWQFTDTNEICTDKNKIISQWAHDNGLKGIQ